MSETYKNMNIEQLRKAAEDGDVEAQLSLGDRYRDGEDIGQDYRQAVYWYRLAAEQGNAEAQNRLGARYVQGQGVDKDRDQAVYWWMKAAEQGCEKALWNLVRYYREIDDKESGKVIVLKMLEEAGEKGSTENQYDVGRIYESDIRDMERAVYWYQKAAEHGNAEAQLKMGRCCFEGKGILQSYKQAMEWFQKAAEQGNTDGYWAAARCILCDGDLEENHQQAIKWFERAANADAGYAWSLAEMYYAGKDMERNIQSALRWYEKAAYEVPNFAWELGEWYYYGKKKNCFIIYLPNIYRGSESGHTEWCDSYEMAENWFACAAEKSWYHAAKLSEEYGEDGTLPPDPQKVEHWCRKAGELLIADQCESANAGNPIAQRVLGDYYYLEHEYDKAVQWYLKAWEEYDRMNNDDSRWISEPRELKARMYFHLGMCYYKGLGIEEDHDTAADWFIRSSSYLFDGWKNPELFSTLKALAVDENNAAAQYGMGICYDNGNGPERDEKLAVEWYQKAAENDNLDAQFEMGQRYLSGEGIPKDPKKGTEMVNKAAEQGFIPAIELLEENKKDVSGYKRIHDRKALLCRLFFDRS